MKCTICHQEIKLVPSAAERAKKDKAGNTAAYYTGLFTEHADCTLRKRQDETRALMKRIKEQA